MIFCDQVAKSMKHIRQYIKTFAFNFSTFCLPTLLVAEFSLLEVAEFLLSSREDDTRSWDNFLVYFSMLCQPKGLGIHIYRLLASQAYAKMLV